ncbi:hypothetical protein GCM10010446_40080 [Streptomyces enissocaesilis]|uniref:DNA primase/polymerase bifunctional N-terminal domain-containing protein n=1 Tax=Streptomyces enissocaesilis TaxID=332589 RepID=A0ABP6JW99_9ACTN
MNRDTAPSWVPASGHALRHAGIHFDAVRIERILGEQAAYELLQFTDFRAGPIVREETGARSMYFLLPPQTAAAHRWPAGVRALGRGAGCAAFVGVPALGGGGGHLAAGVAVASDGGSAVRGRGVAARNGRKGGPYGTVTASSHSVNRSGPRRC